MPGTTAAAVSTDRGLSMTSLASQLNDIFRRQHSVNQLQFTLGSVNYLVNVFNFTQNIHLQNSVKRGQAEIDELTFVIGQLKTEIESLNLDVEDQRQASIRLRSQLATLQDVLSRTTREHRRELTVHRKMIDKQETLIAKMVRLRAHQDLLADTIVAVLALGISRLLPVGSALRMVTHMALQPSRQRTMVRRGLHVAVYLAIVLRLRSWFVACGLHSTGRTDDDHQDSRRGLSQSAAVVLLRPFWIAHSLVHGIVRTAASAVSAVVRR
ncbi:hypothetical protein BC831DRAFT_463708 [Entophlyctis helioformis]|nr:hypothetical protein BC831DRAFT_463708 [Entophlyctis helioformis]